MSEKRRIRKTGKRLFIAYALRGIMAAVFVLLLVLSAGGLKRIVEETFAGKQQENLEKVQENVWQTESYQRLVLEGQSVTVMLDAGHGGNDPGTMSDSVYEKDITLDVALKVRDYLKECGVNVIMTREDDTFIDKYERAELANEKDADVFISIHCNFLEDNPEVSGVETYYVENAEDGMCLATAVHEQVLLVTGADDMYVRTNDFVVIKNTNMPAALVEIGYLSNDEDVKRLSTEEYRQKVAYGIAAGIVEYINGQVR